MRSRSAHASSANAMTVGHTGGPSVGPEFLTVRRGRSDNQSVNQPSHPLLMKNVPVAMAVEQQRQRHEVSLLDRIED